VHVQILDGIYQLLTPFPAFTFEAAKQIRGEIEHTPKVIKGLPYVLPYMIKSGGDVALVDCGWNTDDAYAALESGMREHGTHPKEIGRLLITHVHGDHYGMSGRLKRISNCEVVIHQKDAEFLKTRYFSPQPLVDEMGRFLTIQGVPDDIRGALTEGSMNMLDRVAPVPPDTMVKGGEYFRIGSFDFQVIWTPGHSAGHICFYEPNHKILLTGDHILPTITPNVSMHAQTFGSPLADYIRSLDVLMKLDVKHVLPAHEYDIKDLKKRIIEIEEHHEVRLDEMIACVDRGGSTTYQVAARVKWATGMLSDFEPHQQRSAVGETLAHLEYLFELGRLSKVMRERKLFWLPV
jgi:glyoxylase-like metal-dependent hydrolase (beta-lactamase superfamily II)